MTTMNIFDMTDTWNAGGTTFTAIKMNATDTASASGSLLVDLQVGGVSQFSISKTGGITGLSNVLEIRNSTTAQALRVYNTDGGVNFERGRFAWVSNILQIGAETGGSGVNRQVILTGSRVTFGQTASQPSWFFDLDNTNALRCTADNAADIGQSGSTRPRNIFIAGYIVSGVVAVASLPAAATAGAGARMFVNNALSPVFGSAVVGGGAVTVPVYSTGSAWNVG